MQKSTISRYKESFHSFSRKNRDRPGGHRQDRLVDRIPRQWSHEIRGLFRLQCKRKMRRDLRHSKRAMVAELLNDIQDVVCSDCGMLGCVNPAACKCLQDRETQLEAEVWESFVTKESFCFGYPYAAEFDNTAEDDRRSRDYMDDCYYDDFHRNDDFEYRF
jgi:hypothetical protein